MRCQTKKWRMERLQLESETRSLKQALQSFGVDTNVALQPDPLLVHYREENERLHNANEELGEKVKDLEESLEEYGEHECCDDPSEELQYMREKMKLLRERFAGEKKRMRDAISDLRLKLAKAEDDTSCAALNRLRAKLRELMKNGEQADRKVADVVEKSMDTMVDLTKGCEELKLTNERLRHLLEDLGMSPEEIDEYLKTLAESPDAYKKAIKESPQSKLLKQREDLQNCEEAMKNLKNELEEKIALAESLTQELNNERRSSSLLASDLDKVSVDYKTLTSEVAATKEELEQKDNKIMALMSELRNSALEMLGMSKLQSEIEDMKPQIYNLQIERDRLLDELAKIRGIVSERNDQIINILEQKEKSEKDCNAKLAVLQAKFDAEMSQEMILKKEIEDEKMQIADLEEQVARLQRVARDCEEQRCLNMQCSTQIDDLKNELSSLRDQLREADDAVKNLSDEKNELMSMVDAMENAAGDLRRRLADEENAKNDLMDRIEATEMEMQNLHNENRSLGDRVNELQTAKDELADEMEKNKLEMKNLMQDYETIKTENESITLEYTEYPQQVENLQSQNGQLMDDLKKKNEQTHNLQVENDAVRKELDTLKSKLDEAEMNKEKLQNIQNEMKSLEGELGSAKKQKEKAEAERQKLQTELGNLSEEKESLKKKLEELGRPIGVHEGGGRTK
ncbi:hypothetical protein KPH14_003743 [Odynerus spinipes]|uniref:Uncharacterized protein n=1 Tax=Odynerus spinipes TaxID=1348599 RepID=A0AAD9RX88_9HYME|nr:hypothetical protein KPH14_003743 [Odynerus spinipes]